MFTGIITHIGKCGRIAKNGLFFSAPSDIIKPLKRGGSICVNGVCLTVTEIDKTGFGLDLMPETRQRTTLGEIKKHDLVNLELPMSRDSRFNGHIVLGHIDGVGIIKKIEKQGQSWLFTFYAGPELVRYIMENGSVAINGISLTLIKIFKNTFTVGIIPHAYTHTMMSQAKVGDKVNIEVDIMAKYVYKFYESRRRPERSLSFIRRG